MFCTALALDLGRALGTVKSSPVLEATVPVLLVPVLPKLMELKPGWRSPNCK